MITRDRRNLTFFLLLTPLLLWVGLLVVIPHIDLFLLSIREKIAPRQYVTSLANYADFFGDRVYVMTLVRTIVMSLLATAITLVIGFPVAYYIAKIAQGRSRVALFMTCLLPFWVSEIVRVFDLETGEEMARAGMEGSCAGRRDTGRAGRILL